MNLGDGRLNILTFILLRVEKNYRETLAVEVFLAKNPDRKDKTVAANREKAPLFFVSRVTGSVAMVRIYVADSLFRLSSIV